MAFIMEGTLMDGEANATLQTQEVLSDEIICEMRINMLLLQWMC